MKKPSYNEFEVTSYLSGNNASYIEELYEDYLKDPVTVNPTWRKYFAELTQTQKGLGEISHKEIRQQLLEMAKTPKSYGVVEIPQAAKQEAVDQLINAYRRFGHLNANIDPLGKKPSIDSRLTLQHYQLSEADLSQSFNTRGLFDKPVASLKEIYSILRSNYCNSIGSEFSYVGDEKEREWLRDYLERRLPQVKYSPQIKRDILKKLIAAEGLEKQLEAKYPGNKRFSIEGGDGLIPMLDEMVRGLRGMNANEVVFGMAHRGRLNVLLNILGQSPQELFQEFEGTKDYGMTSGDVKYHRGFSSDVMTHAGPVHLSLAI